MKSRVIHILLLLTPALAVGQVRLFVSANVGQYRMGDMKELQKNIETDMQTSGLDFKTVSSFPVSLQFETGILKQTSEKIYAGVFFNYAVTKGRVQYSDYSGQVYTDQDLSRKVVGGMVSGTWSHGFGMYGKLGVNFSKLTMNYVTKVHGVGSSTDRYNFYSIGGSLESGLLWSYTISKVTFSVNAGYELNLQGKTKLNNNKKAFLQNDDGTNQRINWSGLRSGLTVAYKFEK